MADRPAVIGSLKGTSNARGFVQARRALLAGATGLVGAHLLRLLEADEAYVSIEVLTRRPVAGGPKAISRPVDFAALPDSAPGGPIDDVFIALGTTMRKAGSEAAFRAVDLDAVVGVARAALARGARRSAIVSAVGADRRSGVFYNRVKGEAEDAVAALGFESLHVMRPSLLLGERNERRPGERAGILFARLLDPFLRGGFHRYRAIAARDVAKAMLASVKLDQRGRFVHEGVDLRALAAQVG